MTAIKLAGWFCPLVLSARLAAANWPSEAVMAFDPALADESAILVQADAPTVKDLVKFLRLTTDQQVRLGPTLTKYQLRLTSIATDRQLTPREKRSEILATWSSLAEELKPDLDSDETLQLAKFLKRIDSHGRRRFIVPLISVAYERYYPSDSAARSIFGDYTGSFRVGIRDFVESPSRRYVVGVSMEGLRIGNSSDKLFVLSPEVSFEYRVPIARELSTFAKVSAGPAYLDYSYNTPDGEHFGAKRFGAEGEFEVGVRFGRVQLAATYYAVTRPSNLNFDGVGLSATWIAVRF